MRAYEWLAGKLRRKTSQDAIRLLAKSAELHRREVERAREEGAEEGRREAADLARKVEDAMFSDEKPGKLRTSVGTVLMEAGFVTADSWNARANEHMNHLVLLEVARMEQAREREIRMAARERADLEKRLAA